MPKIQERTDCFHCGETCQEEVIHHDGHEFCCHGCKTVYTLLQDTGLTTYYEIENSPGANMRQDRASRDFLDLEEVQKQFIDFSEDSVNKVTFYLPTVHCSACIWLLEKLDRLNKGITRSEVNFLRKELTVFFDTNRISLRELVILLEDLGYPPDLKRDRKTAPDNSQSKKLLLKLGVAGFCFGNIMLFSFPEYLSLSDASLEEFKTLFSYLNLFLALPVLFFSDVDYLKSAWKSLKVGYLTIDVPIALGIATLFGRSAFEVISGTGPGYFDSFAGLVFFLLVGKWYQSRTYEALAFDRDFKSYFPMAVARIKDGVEEVCMLENIEVGDRLRILNKQVIPADAVLMTGQASVDYSFVNGESEPVSKKEGDYLYAGGRQTGGIIEVQVVKEVSQGYLTSLWNQRAFDKEQGQRAFSGLIDRISKFFSIGILMIAFITLAYWLYADPSEAFDAFTAVLIIACPCALALSMPFASGSVSRILGKLGFFVKNASTLEHIAQVNTVVFDKTGTLTQGNSGQVKFQGDQLSANDQSVLAALVNSSTHPLSVSIRSFLPSPTAQVQDFNDISGVGVAGSVNGKHVAIGSLHMLDRFPQLERQSISLSDVRGMSSIVHVWIDNVYRGYFQIQKELRSGMKSLIESLRDRFDLHLLSGDNEREHERMTGLFGTDQNVRFHQSPQAKLDYVKQLREKGQSVMMLGDGLNDAGALKEADVGIAVADDVFSFSPACDAILQADRLQHLSRFFRYTRQSMNIVKASVAISLMYNIIGLFFAVQSELTPVVAAILMPLSSVTAVGFVSIATHLLRPRV